MPTFYPADWAVISPFSSVKQKMATTQRERHLFFVFKSVFLITTEHRKVGLQRATQAPASKYKKIRWAHREAGGQANNSKGLGKGRLKNTCART